jgi:tetratricopeptide (TPR) repeat protein
LFKIFAKGIYTLILAFILSIVSFFDIEAKEPIAHVYVIDKDEVEIVSGIGVMIDHKGLIATKSVLILRWLDDIQNNLIVKIDDKSYSIEKLIYFNKKKDIALFSINKDLKSAIPITDNRLEQIKKIIDTYEKGKDKDKEKVKEVKGKEEEIKVEVKEQTTCAQKGKDIRPQYPETSRDLALDLYKKGKYIEAIEVYKRLLFTEPSAELYNRLGVLYLLIDEYPEAIDVFNKAKEINPSYPETYFNLGILYSLKGDKDKVFEYYIILKKLDRARAEELFDFAYR